jgi:drug/metabolite transporter (DMT)-like permease
MDIKQLEFLYLTWTISDFYTLLALLIIAFAGTIGIFSLVYAYNIGSPQSNAPAEYVLLVYALLAGYFIFGEIPDLLSILGMVLISLSGTYIFVRESVREQLVAAEKQW